MLFSNKKARRVSVKSLGPFYLFEPFSLNFLIVGKRDIKEAKKLFQGYLESYFLSRDNLDLNFVKSTFRSHFYSIDFFEYSPNSFTAHNYGKSYTFSKVMIARAARKKLPIEFFYSSKKKITGRPYLGIITDSSSEDFFTMKTVFGHRNFRFDRVKKHLGISIIEEKDFSLKDTYCGKMTFAYNKEYGDLEVHFIQGPINSHPLLQDLETKLEVSQ